MDLRGMTVDESILCMRREFQRSASYDFQVPDGFEGTVLRVVVPEGFVVSTHIPHPCRFSRAHLQYLLLGEMYKVFRIMVAIGVVDHSTVK